METRPVHTVVMYPRPHPDNIVGLFLLREFGADQFLGIREAKLEFWGKVPEGKTSEQLEVEGYLLIDMGGGKFDHHQEEHTNDKQTCATTLIARYLNVHELPELKKLIEYVRRDDLEGKGIMSKDPIDRAFGLSAIIMNLNRDYPDNPEYVVDVVLRIVLAHHHEEYRRKVLMPQEWDYLQQNGLAEQFTVQSNGQQVKVVVVQTDSKAMVGFLRSVGTIQADVVVQRLSTGHTNIVTRQTDVRLNLLRSVAAIRKAEAAKLGVDLSSATEQQLEKPRRLDGIDAWYFDTAANTIQNGGAAAADVPPTRLSLDEVKTILKETLQSSMPTERPMRQDRPFRRGPRMNRPNSSPQDYPSGPRPIRLADLRNTPPPRFRPE